MLARHFEEKHQKTSSTYLFIFNLWFMKNHPNNLLVSIQILATLFLERRDEEMRGGDQGSPRRPQDTSQPANRTQSPPKEKRNGNLCFNFSPLLLVLYMFLFRCDNLVSKYFLIIGLNLHTQHKNTTTPPPPNHLP